MLIALRETAESDRRARGFAPRRARRDGGYVVVADDDECLRDLLAEWLEDSGIGVRCLPCGEACVDEVAVGSPAAVLLDQHMDGMTGEQAIRAMHALAPDLPLVAMTGDPSPATTAALLRGGADAVLTKPFHRDELLACLRRVGAISVAHHPRIEESA